MRALTGQQHEVLQAVDEFVRQTGYPPTMKEIGEAVGLRNVNAVRGHLLALEKKGYIARTPDRARSIRILHAPSALSRLKRTIHRVRGTDQGVLHRVVYGLAWTTRQTSPLLSRKVRGEMSEAIDREAVERGWEVLDKSVAADHVVVVIKVWPNHSPELTVRRLKAAGEAVARKSQPRGGRLWTRGYAITTDLDWLDELVGELLEQRGQ